MKRNFLLSLIFLFLACSSDSNSDSTPEVVTFTLTTIASPEFGGTITPSSGTYVRGSSVSLSATPSANYVFINWTGTVSGSDNPVNVVINSDSSVTAIFESDDDNDGVPNSNDLCPNTPNGESVNTNGCSDGQLDNDNDGIVNSNDDCPDTPEGESVDVNGCSDSQLDNDNDGIVNSNDDCPDTPEGESVNSNGCSISQDANLLGLYYLDGNANDSSGNSNDGIIVGQVVNSENRKGQSNSAIDFGDSAYVEVSDPGLLNPNTNISISVWVYKYDGQINWEAILNKWEYTNFQTVEGTGFYLGLNPSGNRLRWNISNQHLEMSTTFPINQWVHIVAMYNNGIQKLYINNNLIGENNVGSFQIANNVSFRIGQQSQIVGDSDFNGIIDDVYIYDRELSENEIAELFNN